MREIKIETSSINLSQFLKWAEVAATGGEAKNFIREGKVRVNGEVIVVPAKKLFPGDKVEIAGEQLFLITGDG